MSNADPLGAALYEDAAGRPTGGLVYRDGADVEPHDVPGTSFTGPAAWTPRSVRSMGRCWTSAVAPGGTLAGSGRATGRSSRWTRAGRGSGGPGRGVEEARAMYVVDLRLPAGRFRSALLIGTQSGLVGSRPAVLAVRSDLAAVIDDDATAIVDSYDPAGLAADGVLGYRPDPRPGVARRAVRVEYRRPEGTREVGPTPQFVLFGPDRLRDALGGTPWALAVVWPREALPRQASDGSSWPG